MWNLVEVTRLCVETCALDQGGSLREVDCLRNLGSIVKSDITSNWRAYRSCFQWTPPLHSWRSFLNLHTDCLQILFFCFQYDLRAFYKMGARYRSHCGTTCRRLPKACWIKQSYGYGWFWFVAVLRIVAYFVKNYLFLSIRNCHKPPYCLSQMSSQIPGWMYIRWLICVSSTIYIPVVSLRGPDELYNSAPRLQTLRKTSNMEWNLREFCDLGQPSSVVSLNSSNTKLPQPQPLLSYCNASVSPLITYTK